MSPSRAPGSRWFATIRVRIVVVIIVLQFAAALGSVMLLRAVLFDRLDAEIETSLEREAEEFQLLAEGVDPTTAEPFDGNLEAIFATYFRREVPDEGESLLAFLDGELVYASRADGVADAEELSGQVAFWLSLDSERQGVLDTPFGPARYVALPLPGTAGGPDGLWVAVNFPDRERADIDAAIRTQGLIALSTLVVVTLIGLVLAGRVLRPLRELASTARTISETDLTRRIEVTGTDEASQIATTFNDMLERLEGAFRAQRDFLDDTSHELRTPMTVVRGHLELLEVDTTAADRQATVDLVIDEIDRLSRIVNDLFLLAHADRPDFLRPTAVDVAELTRDVHRRASVLADRDWRLQGLAQGTVPADRHRLVQAMVQLADNAVKHTGRGDVVTIGSELRQDRLLLWVDDTGRGIAPEDQERVFDRFVRGSTEPVGAADRGAGLGLSIVVAIAEAHGGSVRLVPRPGPGCRFEISVPATHPEVAEEPRGQPAAAIASRQ